MKKDKPDAPLRAKSVCLAERPKSQYGRNIRSADTLRSRFSDKQYVHRQPSTDRTKRNSKTSVIVKKQKRNVVEKVPCAVSVQTLSIPMTYDAHKHPTSKPLASSSRKNDNITKCNLKQVERKLCHAVCGRETENKLLLQISEADQVSDFERILNSNAILLERARRQVWRGSVSPHSPSAFLPRPRSTYSLRAVSQAYHTLFRQHEESLQQLADRHREEAADHSKKTTSSLLDSNWFENLQGLTEFYEDDPTLQAEIETITDRIIADAAQAQGGAATARSNFNVNLAGLISLHVSGEGVSPTFRDDLAQSPEVDTFYSSDDKEWLSPIMSANSVDRHLQDNTNLDRLAEDLNTVQIECDGKVPTITFSNCCEGRGQADNPNNNDVVIHLAVPSTESADEARPPMM